ncbi:HNH endonuclease [Acinetobacter phage nACB1]|nr:HNH endonuclease [Acinetobacter phage nACB1]
MIWKPIPNFEGYDVSDQGQVRSWRPKNGRGSLLTTPHLLSLTPFSDSDYLRVNLGGKSRRVHQLVLEAFVGPCPKGHLVMHLDDDCTNNNLSNLKYGTPKENLEDMVKKNRSCKGEKHYRALVSDADRDRIIALAKTKQYYGGLTEVADELAFPRNIVRRVIELYNISASKEGKPHLTYKNRRM